jgi:hypothetical protein
VAKLVARLLAAAALCLRVQASSKNTKWATLAKEWRTHYSPPKKFTIKRKNMKQYIPQRNSLGNHCCQMAEFWDAGLKNGPVKLLAAWEISGQEPGPIPNFLIAA